MGYIAREIRTNKVYYSKGANKLADKIGCNYSTITKYFSKQQNKGTEKEIKGFIISETIDLTNQNRGNNIKINV